LRGACACSGARSDVASSDATANDWMVTKRRSGAVRIPDRKGSVCFRAEGRDGIDGMISLGVPTEPNIPRL
jgi:hypothetical protein